MKLRAIFMGRGAGDRFLTRAAGEGDRAPGPAAGRPEDRLRRWRGRMPAVALVPAPSTMLRMVPLPRRPRRGRNRVRAVFARLAPGCVMNQAVQVAILGLALGGVYALMASGLTLIFGVMG